ncbi:G-type lectin S-receptor-like serine/threonine-protein kinase LECRK3 [Bidens hawaiensis]|uniref:G-type lectin S-receptor-like serine/threonine-protein kinase LECRK3 n=1 Tax=Bidens hawaiensis TaxID=980011 RepID=UPI0040499C8E
MALVPIRLISLAILLHFVAAQQPNGSVSVGASLTTTPNARPWLSPSGEFAFGFQQVQGSDNFLLSIWYDKIPDKTIVWYPEGGPTVSPGSKVDLVDRRGLVLSDPQGRELWSSGSISDLAYGYMNDTGNFVIVDSNSRNIWESFDHPADTLLPTQVMARGGVINSKMGEKNYTGGKFQLRLLQDGNLVLNTRDVFTGTPDNAYYISGTRDADNSSNSGDQLIFDPKGYMYILRRNGESVNLTGDSLPSGDYYHRATLDSDGVFTQYYHPKNPTQGTSWEIAWFVPENICRTRDAKACGLNNVCILDNNRPTCECPRGFSLVDPNTPYGDCKPYFTPSCDEGESSNAEDVFDFIELTNTDWPGSDFVSLNPSDEETCRSSCLKDCFCAVAIYRDNQCWKKQLPLTNGYKDPAYNVKALLKFRKFNGPVPGENKSETGEDKSEKSLILVGSVLLGASVLVTVVLIGVIYVHLFKTEKKKGTPLLSSATVETNLPHFTYQELVEATNGFKDELGKGAFGTVYKGVIGTKIVAIKKLETVVQDGQKEFITEVNTIARTHHKNLVQLLGYCDDGEKRLLIYEYMANGTLADFLFGGMRPSWKQKSYIALGVAKGLTYLHEECSNQIIHCDIKPQNILLDDYYNAKIADFGLAKLLLINQSRTNTGIRGTKGYVAPEWFRNTPVTFKVDVYSFGVLLLEIISCRKSVVFDDDAEDVAVLTDMAWDCFQDGRLDAFVENDLEALDDLEKLTTFMMVGLWCVQENPSLRPTMKRVIQMLEGGIEVTEPPCPCPLSVASFSSSN